MANLTKRSVEALKPGAVLWDQELKGFGARCRTSGARYYLVKFRARGQQRWVTIGRHGSPWTAETARTEALRLISAVKVDRADPAAIRDADKQAVTVSDLCDWYLREGCAHKKPSTLATDRGRIERHIKPLLGTKRAKDLTRAEIQRFHDDVAAGKSKADIKTRKRGRAIVEGGKGTAARTTGLLGGILTFAVDQHAIASNPARGIRRAKDRKREVFLSDAQFAELGTALSAAENAWREHEAAHDAWLSGGRNGNAPTVPRNAASPTAVAAVRLLVFTGCRKSEILTLKWEHVDFERRLLNLPDSKTDAKVVRLGAPALAVLDGVTRIKDNPYVLPGDKAGRHFVGLAKAWERLRNRAELNGVRLHDLRHSFASVAAARGDSLLVIGKLLGHAQPSTTARYAHLAADPLQQAADRVASHIEAAMNLKPVDGQRADQERVPA